MDRPSLEALASEWLVYGDSLQETGDPRGELVGLSHAIDEGRTEAAVRDAYVREHGVRLLGGAKQFVDKLELEWRFCEIVSAEVHVGAGDSDTAIVRSLLDAPCASLLSHVTLCGHGGGKGDPQLDLSAAVALLAAEDRVKQVGLVDDRATKSKMLVSRDFDPDQNLVTFGTLEGLWPKVERLKIVCADSQQLQLGTIDAPELRSFVLHSLRYGDGWGGEPNPISNQLAEATWPQLAELELRLPETWMANTPEEIEPYVPVYSAEDSDHDEMDEGDIDGVNWNEIAGLLANVAKCPLRRLALTSFYSGTSLLTELSNAGVAKSLVELDLSHSELRDEHLDIWIQNPTPFKHVKRLVVDGTYVTEEGMTKVRALGVEVVKGESAAGAPYRYVVGQE